MSPASSNSQSSISTAQAPSVSTAASSHSSNGSASGPNRFRGDVPSFSPSAHLSPGINHQPIQHPHHPHPLHQHYPPQQQFYQPYPGQQQPFMMNNQFMSYFPVAMAYPPTQQMPYDYSMYAQYQQYYPMSGQYQTPPQYMNVNGLAGGYNNNGGRPKNPHKHKNYTAQLTKSPKFSSPTYQPDQISQTPPVKAETSTVDETPGAEGTTSQTESPPAKEDHLVEEEAVASSGASIDISAAAVENSDEKDTPASNGVRSFKTPLTFNVVLDQFASDHKNFLSTRQQSLKAKNDRLHASLVSKHAPDDASLLIKQAGSVKVVDLNTNSEYYKTIPSTNATATTAHDDDNNTTNETNDTATTPKPAPVSNWAAVLQGSPAAKKAAKPKAQSQPAQPSRVSPPPNAAVDVALSANALPTDSALPLGILILKIMFDSSYAATSTYPAFKVKPRGLTNTGNICYMNAILQVLLYCEPFNKVLKVIDEKAVGSLSQKSVTPIMDATLKFFNNFSSRANNSNKALSPDNFYMHLITQKNFQHLKWGQQEDAEEFLGYFLDGLHEEFVNSIKNLTTPQIDELIQTYQNTIEDAGKFNELKLRVKNTIKIIKKLKTDNNVEENSVEVDADPEDAESGWSEVGTSNKKVGAKRTVEIEPSPITSIFGGQFRSVLTIPKNKEGQSITLDPFQCIQLDISDPGVNTIEEAFVKLNEPEQIPYKSSSNADVMAKKQTFIDQLPNIMIIHLKRFSYQQEADVNSTGVDNSDNGWLNSNGSAKDSSKSFFNSSLGSIEKLRKKITYSHTLTIPQVCFSTVIQRHQPAQKSYKLIGVVYHHGLSADGGHYTADILRKSSVYDNEEESVGKTNDNEWIRIDDTAVSSVEKDEVLDSGADEVSKTAYILFYQKI